MTDIIERHRLVLSCWVSASPADLYDSRIKLFNEQFDALVADVRRDAVADGGGGGRRALADTISGGF